MPTRPAHPTELSASIPMSPPPVATTDQPATPRAHVVVSESSRKALARLADSQTAITDLEASFGLHGSVAEWRLLLTYDLQIGDSLELGATALLAEYEMDRPDGGVYSSLFSGEVESQLEAELQARCAKVRDTVVGRQVVHNGVTDDELLASIAHTIHTQVTNPIAVQYQTLMAARGHTSKPPATDMPTFKTITEICDEAARRDAQREAADDDDNRAAEGDIIVKRVSRGSEAVYYAALDDADHLEQFGNIVEIDGAAPALSLQLAQGGSEVFAEFAIVPWGDDHKLRLAWQLTDVSDSRQVEKLLRLVVAELRPLLGQPSNICAQVAILTSIDRVVNATATKCGLQSKFAGHSSNNAAPVASVTAPGRDRQPDEGTNPLVNEARLLGGAAATVEAELYDKDVEESEEGWYMTLDGEAVCDAADNCVVEVNAVRTPDLQVDSSMAEQLNDLWLISRAATANACITVQVRDQTDNTSTFPLRLRKFVRAAVGEVGSNWLGKTLPQHSVTAQMERTCTMLKQAAARYDLVVKA